MDKSDEFALMLDRMARVAEDECPPPRLNIDRLMTRIPDMKLLEEKNETIPWYALIATGAVAAAAAIVFGFAFEAWHDLHDPFVDLVQYVEFII